LSPAEAGILDLAVDAAPRERYALAARHPSGAVTFHFAHTTRVTRRGRNEATSLHFSVHASPGAASRPARRGLLSRTVRVVVLRLLGTLTDVLLPTLSRAWETARWRARGIERGLLRVTPEGLRSGRLGPADPGALAASPQRNLLLIHGTFSNAAAAFTSLADTAGAGGANFFAAARALYDDRIFAFNHFTVSRTPEDNARDLLRLLPNRPVPFDVVTHSRGGLVLRTLVERPLFGALSRRFELGRAVLVACPNEGTPLATPAAWDKMVGWIANLMDLFPDNPLALGVEFVTEALIWLAHRAGGALPGIAPMATDSEQILALQAAPLPPTGSYAVLAANHEPDAALLPRLADAGVDAFFRSANDLLVPTEGSWRVDLRFPPAVPGDRVGCFGPGGNLEAAGAGAVHHLNFFSRPETVGFLLRALNGERQPLAIQDLESDLPYRGRGRSRAVRAATVPAPLPAARPQASPQAPAASSTRARPAALPPPIGADNVLHLFVLSSGTERREAELLAMFRNARVLERFETRGGEAGERWRRIIAMQERIQSYIDGAAGRGLPEGEELKQFGAVLFQTLFPPPAPARPRGTRSGGEVGRLYDVARSLQGNRRLDIIFTSMIDWVADKPWEFAYDPGRDSFLATEEVNFLRNVLTSVPADEMEPVEPPLRILVAVAQPLGTAPLSSEEETAVIKRGFRDLEQAGLAVVEVATHVTPDLLHRKLQASPFEVLHFVGHGEHDERTHQGFLLFEDERGRQQRVGADVVRQILGHRGIRLVFLNACETGTGGRADFNKGVAQALVAAGVPAVVANQYKVLDPSATVFAQHFYWALAQGRSLGDAARESRIAVNYSISGETIDWAVPVVYARNPREVLCRPPAESRLLAVSRLESQQVRRWGETRSVRVGLWDVNHVVAPLERIAQVLTAAQDRYGFEVVDIAAPFGTWRLHRKEKKEEGFLHGGMLSERLAPKPRELGLDHLFCITTFRIGGRDSENVFLWSSDVRDPDGRVRGLTLFSLHGLLSRMDPPRLTLERAIANVIAGSLSGIPEHKRAPRDCPRYSRLDRDIHLMAGALRFDASCRRRIPREALPALRRLLTAFGARS
jgi:hypothetical protein